MDNLLLCKFLAAKECNNYFSSYEQLIYSTFAYIQVYMPTSCIIYSLMVTYIISIPYTYDNILYFILLALWCRYTKGLVIACIIVQPL